MSTNDDTNTHRTRTNRRDQQREDIARANDVEALTTSDGRIERQINRYEQQPITQTSEALPLWFEMRARVAQMIHERGEA